MIAGHTPEFLSSPEGYHRMIQASYEAATLRQQKRRSLFIYGVPFAHLNKFSATDPAVAVE